MSSSSGPSPVSAPLKVEKKVWQNHYSLHEEERLYIFIFRKIPLSQLVTLYDLLYKNREDMTCYKCRGIGYKAKGFYQCCGEFPCSSNDLGFEYIVNVHVNRAIEGKYSLKSKLIEDDEHVHYPGIATIMHAAVFMDNYELVDHMLSTNPKMWNFFLKKHYHDDALCTLLCLASRLRGVKMFQRIYDVCPYQKTPWHLEPTFLHRLVPSGNAAVIEFLLSKGIGFPIDSMDKNYETPLFIAAKEGLPETCKVLIEHGANPMYMNLEAQNCIDVAKTENVKRVLRGLEIIPEIVPKQEEKRTEEFTPRTRTTFCCSKLPVHDPSNKK